MKIERHKIKIETISLDQFADVNNLVLVVNHYPDQLRYTAFFKGTEVKEGSILRSIYGQGSNEEQAILDYVQSISGKKLVINAYSKDNRQEIEVPHLSF